MVEQPFEDPVPQPVEPLPWASRISAMPYLPGGGSRQVETLNVLLTAIADAEGVDTHSVDLGDGIPRTLKEAVKQVAPAGLVNRVDRDHVTIPAETQHWQQTQNPLDLLAIFHRHVRYVGELLQQLLDGPRTMRELQEAAAEDFDLPWTTLDQARRRVTWFTTLGLTEYKTSTSIGLTGLGETAVSVLVEGGPESAPKLTKGWSEETIEDPPAPIAELLTELTPQQLSERHPVLGYIPRGQGGTDVIQALTMLVNACSPQISRADLLSFAKEAFGVSDGSFGAVLTTLTKSGLIEQTGYNIYSPTAAGTAWLEYPTAANLVLLLHTKFLFFLEIIPLLTEFDRAPDLARAAVQHYGLQRVDVGGVRTRLQILKAAGLIYERANWRYQATPLGENFAHTFPVQQPDDQDIPSSHDVGSVESRNEQSRSKCEQLVKELVDSATAADTPLRLEKAVTEAFSALGFEARHVGGGGKTDVLATVDAENGDLVRVIIDAKAARSGTVLENAISFDTLREHKKHHEADHVVLIGPSFDAGRTKHRAKEHGVRLITVEDLASVLRRHDRSPQSAFSYTKLLSPSEEHTRELDLAWTQNERRLSLLVHVVAVLAEEVRERDEMTGGALTASQIYLIIRDEVDPRPSAKDIEEVVEFLEHPLIKSISRIGGGKSPASYYLNDRPSLVAAKLSTIARSFTAIDLEE
ncbi:hypothetical protein ACTXN7_09755 [Corynebacterium flavescens]|uniref:hypothetical protein n=1 Tax=Corynebacterium flavescens TaxID=28028 RepID=UPI003FD2ACD8